MHVLRDPDDAAALAFLTTELAGLAQRRGHLIQIVADCTVTYQGRATSTLSRGERLVILKPDGTLLVHTAEKAKPVNWQPPGASFSVAQDEIGIHLTSHRVKPAELVRIDFHRVVLLVAVPLRDEADLALLGSEDDLQALLAAQPHLVEPGFVPSRRERDTRRGYLDLDGHDAQGRRVIVEVKRTTAGVKEAQQLWRYVEERRGADGVVRGILVAPRVAPKARQLLADHGLEWKELEWSDIQPRLAPLRQGGQKSLGAFADGSATRPAM